MDNNKKNKVDAVIDEVLESKRVAQASNGILQLLRLVSAIAIPVFGLIALIDPGGIFAGSVLAGISFIVFLVSNWIINKQH